MLQNIFVAERARSSKAFGIHTELVNIINNNKISKVLVKPEERYLLVNLSLFSVLYLADFRVPADQKKFWKFASQHRHIVIADINKDSIGSARILAETHPQVLGLVESVAKGS